LWGGGGGVESSLKGSNNAKVKTSDVRYFFYSI
jgi:hypothetical protein